jgi:hypothetical protein
VTTENSIRDSPGGESMGLQSSKSGEEMADTRTWAIGGRGKKRDVPSDIFQTKCRTAVQVRRNVQTNNVNNSRIIGAFGPIIRQ